MGDDRWADRSRILLLEREVKRWKEGSDFWHKEYMAATDYTVKFRNEKEMLQKANKMLDEALGRRINTEENLLHKVQCLERDLKSKKERIYELACEQSDLRRWAFASAALALGIVIINVVAMLS